MSPKPKEQLRTEAETRNAAWNALSLEHKLGQLHDRRGMSKRQRDRLMAPLSDRISKRAAARREAIATRYGQCDDACTSDCGHCKGNGVPS